MSPRALGFAAFALAALIAGASRDCLGQAEPATRAPELEQALRDAGFENISAARDSAGARVAYENRRYRHSATALGIVGRASSGPTMAYERRLGLVAAAVRYPGQSLEPIEVLYPSDAGFPAPPDGSRLAPTSRSLDLLVGPLLTYELGRIVQPALFRVEIQPELRYNPWTGGRLRLGLVIPIRNDFEFDELHPDVDRVRPGVVALDQFAWSKGAALFSTTAGLLGNNRYGFSIGIARPLAQGTFLLDAQTDVTGFFALSDSGSTYSTPSRWTGFAGVTYRPGLDLGVRLRAARFIHEDDGIELEVRRSMGDLDVAFSALRVQGETVGGVRFVFPIPPATRPTGSRVRLLPVERFPFSYREETLPVGISVANVASREDFLRQLDRPSLTENSSRFERAQGATPAKPDQPNRWVSLTGMTGFVQTPWCGVMGDKEIEFGYNRIPKGATYQYTDSLRNDVYYWTLGFLPHLEVGLRWTIMPGAYPFRPIVPESDHVDNDRMFSFRLEVLEPKLGRPGLAIGAEDFRGTKRFHSTYAVAGIPFEIYRLQNRVTFGYAPRVFKEVGRRTLDGLFGACEVSPLRSIAVTVEHDSDKWNAMIGVGLGFGLKARAALLDLEHLSFGAGWFKAL